jgi:beta-barrel assembly-enhancing protease
MRLAIIVTIAIMLTGARPVGAAQTEAQMGADVYADLKQQGVLVASSPLYNVLRPISDPIAKAAEPQYGSPIHFYIVHGKDPNAFAAPGGNVYVIDSLLYFVKNKEELQGTLCHETSHLIHHDSLKEQSHDDEIAKRQFIAMILLGPSLDSYLATKAVGNLDSMHYSRNAEETADITGADTCANAGLNPWGLVWLFQDFSNANLQTPPEILSDHPNNQHRIDALEAHFRDNPAKFSKFSSNRNNATPLNLPKDTSETFVR